MFYMATTKISPDQTAVEIQKLLGQKGARQILSEYENGEIVAISFLIDAEPKEIAFRLPLRWQDCLETMKRDPKTPNHLCKSDQAKRTAWRVILRWLQAQFALIDSGMATLTEVMLPYARMGEQTLYERMIEEKFRKLPGCS